MKCTLCLLLLCLVLVLLSTCKENDSSQRLLANAELFLESNPDSSYFFLNKISDPDRLNNNLFACWCMMSCKLTNKLSVEIPFSYQLNRAYSWFIKYGSINECAQIGLYLGRSYMNDKEYDKAMKEYLNALSFAERCNDLDMQGYIYSYMGDLYSFKDMPRIACEKYNKGASCFKQSNNLRSYALALRDVGRMCAFQDSLIIALSYLKKADSIATNINDTYTISSISNGIGNVYSMLDSVDQAEAYLLKSLKYDSLNMAPTYLALSNIYINKGSNLKAQYYLDMAKKQPLSEYILARIVYQHYLIEKEKGFFEQALNYLEKYESIADSVTLIQNEQDILNVEKKYNQIRLLNENSLLKVNKQNNIIVILFMSVFIFFILYLYQTKIRYKNKRIYEQQSILDKKDIEILRLLRVLNNKKNELDNLSRQLKLNRECFVVQNSFLIQEYEFQKEEVLKISNMIMKLRKERFESLSIIRKIIKLANKNIPGAKQSPLSQDDWDELKNEIDKIYITIDDILRKKDLNMTVSDMRYCYLSLLNLSTIEEAILLHINPTSVIKRRFRVRKKLGIIGEDISISDYLMKL